MTKSFHRTFGCFLMEFLLFEGLRTVTTADLYASYGEDILLASPHEEVHEWQFPVRNEILADCTNGKVEVNFRLNRSRRLNITSNCSLLIQNFTKDDVGLYKCFRFDKGNSSKNTYEIDVQLRKLEIDEASDANLVQGTEGKITTLTCSLEGGSSNDMLHWIKDTKTLTSGKPPSLKYTFMADQSDDMKEFICRGIIMTISYFLTKKSHLTYIKRSTFGIKMFGEKQCKRRCRDIVMVLQWKFIKNNTNMLVLNNVNNEMSGQYICKAQNKAGRENDTVNITVADRPETPRNFQVIALKFEIIVKWKAGKSDGMLQTFVIEYRKHFELEWIIVPEESKTSTVIDGLQMNTVYFVRAFSETIGGQSNRTDDIIVKTGTHLVPHSCSLEIGIITSAAAVVVFFCLCAMKATSTKRFCLNMTVNRNNGPQGNETIPETRGPQYYEIDSLYYNPSNANGRRELTLNHTPIEALLSLINSRNTDNVTADNAGTGNCNHEITQSGTDSHIPSADNVSKRSSSDDSYLVPSRNYINLEIGFTDEHIHQITEPEFFADGASASNSESSETHIKSENQYETLAATNIVEHSYESTIETY